MDCASFIPQSLMNTSDSDSVRAAAEDVGSGLRRVETEELPEEKDGLVKVVELTDWILPSESLPTSSANWTVENLLGRDDLSPVNLDDGRNKGRVWVLRALSGGERERRIFRRNPSMEATSHTERALCRFL